MHAHAPGRAPAKVLSHWAKHTPETGGTAVWDRLSEGRRERILETTPVGDVWGIGRRNAPRLMAMNITNALDLRNAEPTLIRHRYGVTLAKTVLELAGTPSISLDGFDAMDGRREHQIICSRIFGQPVTGLDELAGAIGCHAQQATVRLRRQHGLTRLIGVWVETSPFHGDYRQAGGWILPTDPTDDPTVITSLAMRVIRMRTPRGHAWVRGGVMLADALDEINRKYGRMHAGIGWAGTRGKRRDDTETGGAWRSRRERLSLRATTRWDELATAHA